MARGTHDAGVGGEEGARMGEVALWRKGHLSGEQGPHDAGMRIQLLRELW